MKEIISLVLAVSILFLTFSCTQYHAQGAGVGGVVGGVAGALLDKKNPWRGGVIGAVLGGIGGATIADISMRASQEAAASGKRVEYKSEDGRKVYQAEPIDYSARNNCNKIKGRVWEDGKLLEEKEEVVCK